MDIVLKPQSLEEGLQFFRRDMQRDFPEDEIKPWEVIEPMVRSGIYHLLGAWQGDNQVGYAWMFAPEGDAILIDYLAVLPEYRGTGVGSTMLEALGKWYPDKLLILESEHPEDAPEPEVARRRLRFYDHAGFVISGVEVLLFGVHFCILSQSPDVNIREHMEMLYHELFPGNFYDRAVKFL